MPRQLIAPKGNKRFVRRDQERRIGEFHDEGCSLGRDLLSQVSFAVRDPSDDEES